MLSLTWNEPPSLPEARKQFTHLDIRLNEEAEGMRVTFYRDGWGEGCEWEQAHAYSEAAWNNMAQPFLVYRFREGPIDWDNPPNLNASTKPGEVP